MDKIAAALAKISEAEEIVASIFDEADNEDCKSSLEEAMYNLQEVRERLREVE